LIDSIPFVCECRNYLVDIHAGQFSSRATRVRLKDGRKPSPEIVVREFSDAAKQFLGRAETKYRKHPNSYKRIKTTFATALDFFENKTDRCSMRVRLNPTSPGA
jgi:hypothetical protein